MAVVTRMPFRAQVLSELSALRQEVRELTKAIKGRGDQASATAATMETAMADIRTQIAELVTKVSDQKTVIEGVTAMLQGLKDQLATAQGNLDAAGEVDASNALAEIMAALDANTDRLAKAAAANTDADDEVHAAGM